MYLSYMPNKVGANKCSFSCFKKVVFRSKRPQGLFGMVINADFLWPLKS